MGRRFLKIPQVITLFVETPDRQKHWFLKRKVDDVPPYFAPTRAFLQPGAFLRQMSTMRNGFLKIQLVILLFVDTPHRQKQWFLKRRVDDFTF